MPKTPGPRWLRRHKPDGRTEKLASEEKALLEARQQAEVLRSEAEQKLRALTIVRRAKAEAAERAADQRLQAAPPRAPRALQPWAEEAEKALATLEKDSTALADYTRMQGELDRLANGTRHSRHPLG